MIKTSGPLTASREQAFLGWNIKIKNDFEVSHPALYAINGWVGRKEVSARGTVNAGYVFGREIPSFTSLTLPQECITVNKCVNIAGGNGVAMPLQISRQGAGLNTWRQPERTLLLSLERRSRTC